MCYRIWDKHLQGDKFIAHKCNIGVEDDQSTLASFRPNLRIVNLFLKELGPSAMLRAIRMCLRPTDANADNIPWLLVSLGYASDTNFP